jgi:AcrR family transcriptional regulator
MNRRYEQRLRAHTADQTRRRILDALAARLREQPLAAISLDDVAERARVARSTIYLVFGSRARLFEAFADDLDARTGLASLQAANRAPDPLDKLRGAVAASHRMYAADRAIFRVLYSMRQLDPGALGGTGRLKEQSRAEGITWLAGLLGDAGHLRPDLTVHDAADVLFVLTSFDTFDALHTDRDRSVDATTALTLTMIERALLAHRE